MMAHLPVNKGSCACDAGCANIRAELQALKAMTWYAALWLAGPTSQSGLSVSGDALTATKAHCVDSVMRQVYKTPN
jgi:hypothetical protein